MTCYKMSQCQLHVAESNDISARSENYMDKKLTKKKRSLSVVIAQYGRGNIDLIIWQIILPMCNNWFLFLLLYI